jgi:hypothetical protein
MKDREPSFNVEDFKPAKGYVLCLKSLPPSLLSNGGFKWPESGHVSAPDWKPTKTFGNGLHAFMWGAGDTDFCNHADNAKWLVLKVKKQDVVDLDGKVKFPKCEVLFCGKRDIAVSIVTCHAPAGTPVMFAKVTGGDGETIIGGDFAILKGGKFSIVHGGDEASATGEDFAYVEAGDFSIVRGGKKSIVKGGIYSYVKGGDFATVSGGCGSAVKGGINSVLTIECGLPNTKKTVFVDGKTILPNVWYRLNKKSEFEKVKKVKLKAE